MKYLIILSLIMCFTSVTACTVEPEKNTSEELLEVIRTNILQEVIMFGHQDDPAYGHSWKFEENRSDVLETAGDYPAVMGWDLGRIEFGDSKNLDGVPFDFMREEINKQHQRGGINTISWHAYTPSGGDSWVKDLGIVTSILPNGKDYEKFQIYLSRVADFLASLKDDEGNLIPIIWRPWHEHDGDWFWWGEKRCTHQEYKELWDMTYDFMTSKGLNNLVWAYMPMTGLDDKMPSEDRYDLFGIDTYQYTDINSKFLKELKGKIEMLKLYGEKFNKPIAITETGYEGIPYEKWWTEVLYEAINGQNISYVLMWRNAWDREEHFYGPYKGHISEADFKAFASKKNIIFASKVIREK